MIYITGNMHGEINHLKPERIKKMTANDTLLVCGDFGFVWEPGDYEEALLNKLAALPFTIAFVDGAHENFDILYQYPTKVWNGGKVHEVRPNILHLMRGEIFTIENKTFFAFGGGDTIEKQLYIENEKWWPQEMPTKDEMVAAVQNLQQYHLKVNYILTHEPCPVNIAHNREHQKTQFESFFEELLSKVTYDQWFYGSNHVDKNVNYKNIAVFINILPLDNPVHPEEKSSFAKGFFRKRK